MIHVHVSDADTFTLFVNEKDAKDLGICIDETGEVITTDEKAVENQIDEVASDLGFTDYEYALTTCPKKMQESLIERNLVDERTAREVRYQVLVVRRTISSLDEKLINFIISETLEERFLRYIIEDAEKTSKTAGAGRKIASIIDWKELGYDRRYRQRRRRTM